MPNFNHRSKQKEFLDEENLPKKDLLLNIKELDIVNQFLGGYSVLFKGIKKLIHPFPRETMSLLDIGSGGGEALRRIHQQFHTKLKLKLIGVDLKADCIEYAKKKNQDRPIEFIQANYLDLIQQQEEQFDIITATLFCHHLSDEELVTLFSWMKRQGKRGFIINDLHRHPLAYYGIKILSSCFSKSYLVKHDGPVSVLRGFKRAELATLLQKAGVQDYEIKWCWAFRYLITVKRSGGG